MLKAWCFQVRLLEEDESYCSYGEAYEVNCARYGREPDIPIISFKRAICNERGDLISDPHGQLRLQVRLVCCWPGLAVISMCIGSQAKL